MSHLQNYDHTFNSRPTRALAKYLYNAKSTQDITYDYLHAKTKINISKLVQILTAQRDPKFRDVVKIARALELDLNYLSTLVK